MNRKLTTDTTVRTEKEQKSTTDDTSAEQRIKRHSCAEQRILYLYWQMYLHARECSLIFRWLKVVCSLPPPPPPLRLICPAPGSRHVRLLCFYSTNQSKLYSFWKVRHAWNANQTIQHGGQYKESSHIEMQMYCFIITSDIIGSLYTKENITSGTWEPAG